MPPTITDPDKRLRDIESVLVSMSQELVAAEKRYNVATQRARTANRTRERLKRIIDSLKRQRDDIATELAESKLPVVVFLEKENNVGYVICDTYRAGDQFVMIKRPGPGFKRMRYPADQVNIAATFGRK